ncbi:MAG: TIR domain-containing protein [Anaerolineales bacterium]|nr:TIR domain-containing protein [Anaerolineales bacterium]
MSEQDTQSPKRSVFISYSRKDTEFVRKLNDSLDSSEIEAWVDWEGIPPSSEWMDEIARAIEGADAFLFVISSNSLASKVCGDELELGIKYNKKFIPILHRDPKKGTVMHEKLSSHNWVYMRKQDDYDAGISGILESINVDRDWVRQHTRLLRRAREWEDKSRNKSFLLQGADLEEAEQWRSQATGDTSRQILPLQGEYIDASRKAASQRQRHLLIGVSFAFAISVILAIYAVFQSQLATNNAHAAATAQAIAEANEARAEENEALAKANEAQARENEARAIESENQAKAQRSAAQAQIYQSRTGELFTSTLLAIDSWEREKSFQAENILRQNISKMPLPVIQASQGGRINEVQFNPDSTLFIAASSNGAACVWKVEDGTQVFCEQHGGKVISAFFIADGQTIVTASADGTVRLLSVADGSVLRRYDFDVPVLAVDISPDEALLAVAREDNTVSVLDLESQQDRYQLTARSAVTAVQFSPNGNYVAFGTRDGSVVIWERANNRFRSGPKHESTVYYVVFSPDSNWIVSVSEDSTARVASAVSGGQKHVLPHDDWLEDVAFGPDSDWFVTVSDDYTIRVWDTESGTEKVRMRQDDFVQEVKVSPNGQWIASTGWDFTARIWSANTGNELVEIPLESYGSALVFSNDGNRLIVGERNGRISVWDISIVSLRIGYLNFPELTHEAHFSPSGEWLAINSDDYKVWLLNNDQWLSTNSGIDGVDIITANGLTYDMAFSPDSKWLAVAEGDGSPNAILYNMQEKTARTLAHEDGITTVAFSPDSQQLAISGNNKLVTVWDVATAEKQYALEHTAEIFSVSYSPTGDLLLAGGNGQVVIWDLTTQTIVETLIEPGQINVIAFSDDGKLFASSSSQGLTYIWEVQEKKFTRVTQFTQNGEALSLVFSPDNKFLAIGGKEGTAYLIDLSIYQEVARIPHVIEVTSVAFSNDGAYLATVSFKATQLWDVSKIEAIYKDDLTKVACTRMTSNMSRTKWEQLFFDEPYRLICPDLPVQGSIADE